MSLPPHNQATITQLPTIEIGRSFEQTPDGTGVLELSEEQKKQLAKILGAIGTQFSNHAGVIIDGRGRGMTFSQPLEERVALASGITETADVILSYFARLADVPFQPIQGQRH